MKKVMLIGLGAVAMSAASLVLADSDWNEFNPGFYVGAELQATKSQIAGKYKRYAGKITHLQGSKLVPMHRSTGGFGAGAGLFAGVSINDWFSIEAGHTYYTHGSNSFELNNYHAATNTTLKTKVNSSKVYNTYGDVLVFVPATENFKFVGAVGVGYLSTKINISTETKGAFAADVRKAIEQLKKDISSDSKAKIRPRFGIGGQYNLGENWLVRGMLRWQKGNSVIKDMKGFGLALGYKFI